MSTVSKHYETLCNIHIPAILLLQEFVIHTTFYKYRDIRLQREKEIIHITRKDNKNKIYLYLNNRRCI